MARRDPERLPTVVARQPSDAESNGRSKAKLRTVSAFDLKPHWLQPPERHSEDNVRDLLVSIVELGLQEPPQIWLNEQGEMIILFGHRRVRACQLGALEGRLDKKIKVFVRQDLTEGEAVKLMMAEYAHRVAFSTLHIARLVGETSRHMSIDRDDEISTRKLAAVLPWEKTQVGDYLTIYRALQDPRLEPHVRRADSAPISLLCNMLSQEEFSTRIDALEAYASAGAGAATKVIRSAKPVKKGGRPPKTVTQRERGGGYDLTVRIRPTMTEAQVDEAEASLLQALDDLREIARQTGDRVEE